MPTEQERVPTGRYVLITAALVLAVLGFALPLHDAGACSCGWGGPLLTVAPHCPLIVGEIVKKHYVKDGMVAWMDVDVHEVLGGYAERGVVRIFGDRGRLCHPSLAMFPVTVTEAPFRFEGL